MSPRAVWNGLRELVPNLDSKTSHLALYKAHLTTLYGDLERTFLAARSYPGPFQIAYGF